MKQETIDLIDLLDDVKLPLKRRVDNRGYYAPRRKRRSEEEKISGVDAGSEHGVISLIPTEPLQRGEQYRFHFDMSKCVGCNCCVVACNEQNNNPAEVNWRRVGEIEGGLYPSTRKYHLSMACNHCLDPSCLNGCPTDAYVKLENGVVKHRAEECIGCGYCSWNCAYGVPQFNRERNIVTKCDMCHSRLEAGQMPACVAACPESAIQIEKVNVEKWRANHSEADAPYVPDSNISLSTTRITLPKDMPENVLRANRHRIEPERPHTSLIFMTVLTQLATGGFFSLWAGDLFSRFIGWLKPLASFLPFGAFGMMAVTGTALSAAIFHLGRPLYAFKALRMWRRSWLSREVLLFALFSKLGIVYAAWLLLDYFNVLSFPDSLAAAIGGLVVVLGLSGVYASAKIYLVAARPAWNTIRTPLRFFLTGFILGPLFALFIYSIYAMVHASGLVDFIFKGPSFALLSIAALASLGQLAVLLSRLFFLNEQASDELYGSSFLLIHRFKPHFLARLSLLILGSFAFPFVLFHLLSLGSLTYTSFVVLAAASFSISLLGEFLGRYLFFVTVVPKSIPGSFFATNGGKH